MIILYLVSSAVKQEFCKLGAIHNSNSTLHTGPTQFGGKRTRKTVGAGRDTVDILDSESDGPFTLYPKVKDTRKHEITIKHERTPDNSPTGLSPIKEVDPLEAVIQSIDRKVKVIDDILQMYDPADSEYIEYRNKKRQLLVEKFGLLSNVSESNK